MPYFPVFIQGGFSAVIGYHFGFSPPSQSDMVCGLSFLDLGVFHQLLELAPVSAADEVVPLDLGGLSNGFRKLTVLFQAFLVPLAMFETIEGLLLLGFDLLVQLGNQALMPDFLLVVVTPLAAGLLEPPNHPSLAFESTAGIAKTTNIHAKNKARKFILLLLD